MARSKTRFTACDLPLDCQNIEHCMRTLTLPLAAALALIFVGCAGPEDKLGRGLRNSTELLRMGEIQRSMEQTYLWDGAGRARTTGFIRGFNRTMVRTGLGLYEIVTLGVKDPKILRFEATARRNDGGGYCGN